jgi:hypothetical protein
VQQAVAAAGVHTAPWLRHMIRHIRMADFPASWREGQAEERSHESGRYGKRFMLRLDDPPWEKLDALAAHFKTSGAEIIRQLLAQATPDTFPARWHRRVVERHGEEARPVPRDADHGPYAAVALCCMLRQVRGRPSSRAGAGAHAWMACPRCADDLYGGRRRSLAGRVGMAGMLPMASVSRRYSTIDVRQKT